MKRKGLIVILTLLMLTLCMSALLAGAFSEAGTATSAGVPQTGEDDSIFVWIALMIASIVGVAVCIIVVKRKR